MNRASQVSRGRGCRSAAPRKAKAIRAVPTGDNRSIRWTRHRGPDSTSDVTVAVQFVGPVPEIDPGSSQDFLCRVDLEIAGLVAVRGARLLLAPDGGFVLDLGPDWALPESVGATVVPLNEHAQRGLNDLVQLAVRNALPALHRKAFDDVMRPLR